MSSVRPLPKATDFEVLLSEGYIEPKGFHSETMETTVYSAYYRDCPTQERSHFLMPTVLSALIAVKVPMRPALSSVSEVGREVK